MKKAVVFYFLVLFQMSDGASCFVTPAKPVVDDKLAYLHYKCYSGDCLDNRNKAALDADEIRKKMRTSAKEKLSTAHKEAELLPSVKDIFTKYNEQKQDAKDQYIGNMQLLSEDLGFEFDEDTFDVEEDEDSDEETPVVEEHTRVDDSAEEVEEVEEEEDEEKSEDEINLEKYEEGRTEYKKAYDETVSQLDKALQNKLKGNTEYKMALEQAAKIYQDDLKAADMEFLKQSKTTFKKDAPLDFTCEFWLNSEWLDGNNKKSAGRRPDIKSALISILKQISQKVKIGIFIKSPQEIKAKSLEIRTLISERLLCDGLLNKHYAELATTKNDALIIMKSAFPKLGEKLTMMVGLSMIQLFNSSKTPFPSSMKEMVYIDEICGASCMGGAGKYMINFLKYFVLISKYNPEMKNVIQKYKYDATKQGNPFNITLRSIDKVATRSFYEGSDFTYIIKKKQPKIVGKLVQLEFPVPGKDGLYPMRWKITEENEAALKKYLADYFAVPEDQLLTFAPDGKATENPITLVLEDTFSKRVLGKKMSKRTKQRQSKKRKSSIRSKRRYSTRSKRRSSRYQTHY